MLKQNNPQSETKSIMKNINTKQNQFNMQNAILSQKIEFLESELNEIKQKQLRNKKLNESILDSFKINEKSREQNFIKQIKDLNHKHYEQIEKIKANHAKEVKVLENQVETLKQKLEQSHNIIQKLRQQIEKKVLQVKQQQQFKYYQKKEEDQQEAIKKIQILQTQLRKAQNTIKLYKEFIQKAQQQKNFPLRHNLSDQYSFFLMDEIRQSSKKKPNNKQKILSNNEQFSGSQVKGDSKISLKRQQEPEMIKRTNTLISITDQNTFSKQQFTNKLSKRQNSSKMLESIQENTRKSRRYLQKNKQNIEQLTTRISRAVSQLEKTSKLGVENKKMEYLKQKIDKKLRFY